jgi:hypothetical protein
MYSLSMRDTGWNDVAVRRTLMMVVASSAPDRGGDDGVGAARKRGLGLRRLLARLTGQAGGAAVLQGNGVIAAVQNDPQAGPSRASSPLSASASSSIVPSLALARHGRRAVAPPRATRMGVERWR